ncbi:tRNA pseudouridine(38-40) synthase TruA [Bacillus benzoevorans]|uniref:tRNA pseudouridine synthase A n=1 Tax=Bacillus benzoevorans TaxID=1456 RepID=A0A7X0HVB4_9BACI|nr:tRNA pseudouridine(38-40) synthase TruA [Bacillus benzoevorans]MBB6447562.1 tRNA pseudouridine38-40 synthase [Bacillus benzoevorans]
MQRYKCTVCYDGTLFSGYQVQPGKRTVQSEIEAALKRLHKGNDVKITASGRTDAGVHAKGQVIHFDSSLFIPEDSWVKALQANLPDDIVIRRVERAESDFHARFDAVGKEYRYFVRLAQEKDPFTRHYQFHFTYPLNVERMRETASYLIGTHDFTSFCSAKSEVVDRVRTISEIELIEEEELLLFRFSGNGFLYNMVRILTGTLLEVGRGLRNPEEIPQILNGKDRQLAGKTAPAHGLYLWKVFY